MKIKGYALARVAQLVGHAPNGYQLDSQSGYKARLQLDLKWGMGEDKQEAAHICLSLSLPKKKPNQNKTQKVGFSHLPRPQSQNKEIQNGREYNEESFKISPE